MTDEAKALVERLRDENHNWHEAACHQAADLIETQAREIERLREELRQTLRNASKSPPGLRIRILADGIRAALGDDK